MRKPSSVCTRPSLFDGEVAAASPAAAPSRRLLRAAVSGLLAVGAVGCDDSDSSDDPQELTDEELQAMCKDEVDDAVKKAVAKAIEKQDLEAACAEMVSEANAACEPDDAELDALCADKVDAAKQAAADEVDQGKADLAALTEDCKPLLGTAEDKTLDSEQKEYTFAALTEMCDERGGYTQIGAACGGHNTCKGFAYADWGPGGATLTEHTCGGANACNGLYCVDTAEDQKRAPKELYAMDFPDPGPNACTSCHAVLDENEEPDPATFKVWVYDPANSPYPGPQRTLENWQDTRSAAEQERMIAFGVHGVLPDGTGYNTMAPYYQFLSRAEIHALVEYIRGELTPVLDETTVVKTQDL